MAVLNTIPFLCVQGIYLNTSAREHQCVIMPSLCLYYVFHGKRGMIHVKRLSGIWSSFWLVWTQYTWHSSVLIGLRLGLMSHKTAILLNIPIVKILSPVFSLNFRSAGKGPFTVSNAKNMHHRGACFWGLAGSGVWEMAPLLLGNLGAKFSEMSLPHVKTYFTQINIVTLTQQIKTTDSNNVLNALSPKCVAHKMKSCLPGLSFVIVFNFKANNNMEMKLHLIHILFHHRNKLVLVFQRNNNWT